MMKSSQQQAVRTYRERLGGKGLSRFEVLGPEGDKELIRSLAKRLARNDADAARIRKEVRRSVLSEPASKGGIFAALQRSPMAKGEADLDFQRPFDSGRKVDL